jgi:hypothetical protein
MQGAVNHPFKQKQWLNRKLYRHIPTLNGWQDQTKSVAAQMKAVNARRQLASCFVKDARSLL